MKRLLPSLGAAVVALGMLSLGWAHEGHDHEKADVAKTEQLLIRAQKICPVSGTELGDHGSPIKAKSGERTIFLCCKGCIGQKIDAQHWKTVNANLATAQGICPVMKKPLPEKPASLVVEGRIVFVCCKPCTNKIAGDPDKYLAVVDAQLAKNVGEDHETK
jgi:hypothetical protein